MVQEKKYIGDLPYREIANTLDELNRDTSHYHSKDDICTPMSCVEKMLDYVPNEIWEDDDALILDPCCGNGNFGAYAKEKTNDEDRIWFNEPSEIRYENCKSLLNPKHLTKNDFLNTDATGKWSLIMANPPYSGGSNKNRSLYHRFITHSIELLKNGGYLCFITPNSWMTYNNNNETLSRLLMEGSFTTIDFDAKRFFNGVGSSFVIFVWQKGVHDNHTKIVNSYLLKDIQHDIVIPNNIPFIPLYVSQETIDIIPKLIDTETQNKWHYRCDLHNYTQKRFLSDTRSNEFQYETIHTARKTRWSSKKQDDIYDKYLVITPLSTYFIPFIKHNVNVTQSVGYIACDTEQEAEETIDDITRDCFKVMIHLTRYGNFNNIMVLKHLRFGKDIEFTNEENDKISELSGMMRY